MAHETHARPGRRLAWGFAGAKPQALAVVDAAAQEGLAPLFWAIPDDASEADRQAAQALAAQHGIETLVLEPAAKPGARDWSSLRARLSGLDLLLTCRFPLLPEEVFTIPRWGAVNIHSSLLPAYRGVHPVSWALVDGAAETGVTLHTIDAGVDTGAILSQWACAIAHEDTLWTLTERLDALSASMAVATLSDIATHGAVREGRPQTGEPGHYARRRTPEDSRFCLSWPAQQIYNLVRALPAPLPPAFFEDAQGHTVLVEAAYMLASGQDAPAGWRAVQAGDGQWLALKPQVQAA